jgi:hypothetical protein
MLIFEDTKQKKPREKIFPRLDAASGVVPLSLKISGQDIKNDRFYKRLGAVGNGYASADL